MRAQRWSSSEPSPIDGINGLGEHGSVGGPVVTRGAQNLPGARAGAEQPEREERLARRRNVAGDESARLAHWGSRSANRSHAVFVAALPMPAAASFLLRSHQNRHRRLAAALVRALGGLTLPPSSAEVLLLARQLRSQLTPRSTRYGCCRADTAWASPFAARCLSAPTSRTFSLRRGGSS